jgi:hypothetical protein
MERLLHYTWRHKLLPLGKLTTTDSRMVEVIDPGLYNNSDAGPDFFNAKVKVDGILWVGNVEIHIKASDWYRHHHDKDSAYDSVILHVVQQADMEVKTSQGKTLTTLELPVAEELKQDYEGLIHSDKYPPCYKIIPRLPSLKVHSWLSSLQVERLQQKTSAIVERVQKTKGSWEAAYFVTLSRNFGFSINGDAFETWATMMPMNALAHHRDNLFQIESIFIGMAGLLDKVDPKYTQEFAYLQKKFGLTPMDATLWRYLRTRPQNFPHVRIMQLAQMYHEQRTSLSQLLNCKNSKEISTLYNIKGAKLDLLIINTVVPTVFAYGRYHANEEYEDRAFDLLEAIKVEDNNIVRMWQECGLDARTAGDSQALIQLKKEYCDKKNCLRCRFGYEFLSGEYRNAFFSEENP